MYYRELRRDYPNVRLADGKTGAELLDALTADPRYLHLLDEPSPLWPHEKFHYRDVQNAKPGQQGFIFQPEGDLTPLMKDTRLLLDMDNFTPRLSCYNFGNNTVRWSVELSTPQLTQQMLRMVYSSSQTTNKYNPNDRFRFCKVRRQPCGDSVGYGGLLPRYGCGQDSLAAQSVRDPRECECSSRFRGVRLGGQSGRVRFQGPRQRQPIQ